MYSNENRFHIFCNVRDVHNEVKDWYWHRLDWFVDSIQLEDDLDSSINEQHNRSLDMYTTDETDSLNNYLSLTKKMTNQIQLNSEENNLHLQFHFFKSNRKQTFRIR